MYVDSYLSKGKKEIRTVERVNGQRVYKTYEPEYTLYVEHAGGAHQTIFGDLCKKFVTSDENKHRAEVARNSGFKPGTKKRRIFESDINPVFRCLADKYRGADTPNLNIAFFDIETAYYPDRGYAPTTDPFAEITAITVYCKWVGRLITLALCPPTLNIDVARDLCLGFEDAYLFDDERELLKTFMAVIDDADILSGWNSEGFDIPYTINRITNLMGGAATRQLCLWNERPRSRTMIQFKKEVETFDLIGRVHLDYMALYKKHVTQQLHSYSLGHVGSVEVGETKVAYEGNLDHLWRHDFVRFIEYNRQDVLLLHKIDEKKKFIELANQVAHANCVLLKTTMGSVQLVEQAIINAMHDMGVIVPDRRRTMEERGDIVSEESFAENDDEDEDDLGPDDGKNPVAGAYVADPKKGLHQHIACADINSLYPSAIRALNMSPETIVGQFKPDETDAYIEARVRELGRAKRAEAWNGLFATFEYSHILNRDSAPLTFVWEDGRTRTMTAREWYEYIWNPKNKLCLTANGTVFSTAKEGMIPALLARWYAERKALQADAKRCKIDSDNETDPVEKKRLKALSELYTQRQLAKKILLNSLYGALLNDALRFYDARLGQSTTLSGRSIDKHMTAKINETITGEYDHKGAAIIYADTDSAYFSAYEVLKDKPEYADVEWTREAIIALSDQIADTANDSFPEFMMSAFNTSHERGKIIKAGRELVASTGLFIKKKKYALMVYDMEGERLDVGNKPGKLKAMGLDLKRADTPKIMQQFLEELLMDILSGAPQKDMFDAIRQFRVRFKERPGWEKGTPKKVSALTDYRERDQKAQSAKVTEALKRGTKGKVTVPGHIRGAINWNTLCEANNDRYAMRIGDGYKTIWCKLQPNAMKMDSVAYPIDETHLPQWFKDLPFAHAEMENTIIDKKISNLVSVLGWDLGLTKLSEDDEFFVF